MSEGICDKQQRTLFHQALLQVIRSLVRTSHAPASDRHKLHALALEGLVHALLKTGSRESAAVRAALQAIEETVLGPLTPEQVGHLYEYGRGFDLKSGSGSKVTLVSSAAGKRNQGLFYTPQPIVRHIVNAALDSLPISSPADYLNVKILDPSVGTGTFLLTVLEQLTDRVLAAWTKEKALFAPTVTRIHERLRETARKQGLLSDLDTETAIRAHIMSTCLYGVDLDPLAVHIANIALQKRAFKESEPVPRIAPHIRVGNALIGSTSGPCSGLDERHARAYFGSQTSGVLDTREWVKEKKVFHWACEFPEVFSSDTPGFDCVIGNPPYEIVSVKESGIHDRGLEQKYFRSMYRTCQGKINTYRLMMERGLNVLRHGGVLGFIVPGTLLADSTADKLRKMFLLETRITETLVIPENVQVFEGVTQAFVVLVCRKGEPTHTLEPTLWDGASPVSRRQNVAIGTDLIERIGFRIPRLNTPREKELLELLINHPPLAGDGRVPAVGRVHQGEMNLTVDRIFITASKTDYPLIRGEHVMPLRVNHPSRQAGRLDWILPAFLAPEGSSRRGRNKSERVPSDSGFSHPPRPWELERIVLGRVVNIETKRRHNAAAVCPGQFLGDMTNFIASPALPQDYLLGLLNSRLLNWRFKLTSTNNYLSAAEVESLPVPRPDMGAVSPNTLARMVQDLTGLIASGERSLHSWIEEIRRAVPVRRPEAAHALIAHVVAWIVAEIRNHPDVCLQERDPSSGLWNALDATVLLLYGCESHVDVLL